MYQLDHQKALEKYRANWKKQETKNFKKRTLASVNYSDFDEAIQQRIKEQVQQADTTRVTADTVSIASSVTSPSVQPKKQDPQGTHSTG